jgi:hypothetical protein
LAVATSSSRSRPSLLGVNALYEPGDVTDDTFGQAVTVHSWSRWLADGCWGDARDDALLAFEQRIYRTLTTSSTKEQLRWTKKSSAVIPHGLYSGRRNATPS